MTWRTGKRVPGEDWHAEFSPASLDEIVNKAGDVRGERTACGFGCDSGRFQNSAIDDLKTALMAAGVGPEEITDPELVE